MFVHLAEKGITGLDRVYVDLTKGEHRQPAFLAVNPGGTIPVLDVGPGGIIRQSPSILEYLMEKYPTPDVIGGTPEARATADTSTAWASPGTVPKKTTREGSAGSPC